MENNIDFFFSLLFVQKLHFPHLPPTPDQVSHGSVYLVFHLEANLSQDLEQSAGFSKASVALTTFSQANCHHAT